MKKLLTLIPLMLIATGAWAQYYSEDAPHATGSSGSMCLAVRNDAGTALAGTTGDYIPLSTDATGALRIGGVAATDLGKAEDAAHTSGDTLVGAAAVRNDGTAGVPTALATTSGDYIPLTTDSIGKLWVTGTQAEDAAHASANLGMLGLSARADSLGDSDTVAGSDNDNQALQTNTVGRLYTTPHDIVEIQATVDVSEAAYASGDAIGTAHTFAAAARAGNLTTRIKAVTVSDIDAQAVNLDLVCYTTNATDPTDNAAYDPVDGEVDNAKVIHITDHTTFTDNSLSQATDLDVVIGPLASTSMECHLVSRGAPDYAAADDLIVTITVDRG